MSTLILHLPAQLRGPETEFTYTQSADGHTVTRHGCARVEALPRPSRAGGDTIALVPISALSWHWVKLPNGVGPNSPRLRAVLEGLLEERVLDELSSLHFAVAPDATAGQSCWVAVCQLEWLQTCLHWLDAAQIPVGRIVPQFHPQPDSPQRMVLGPPETAVCVITEATSPGALQLLPLIALPHWLAQQPPDPSDTIWTAEPAMVTATRQILGQEPRLQTGAEQALQASSSAWNLAQFSLSRSGQARALRGAGRALNAFWTAPQWRPARWGAMALVAIHLIGLNVCAWNEKRTLAYKEQAIRQVLTDTFPHVQIVIDAPVQMQREVDRLRQEAGVLAPHDLEALLASAAAVISNSSVPRQVRYDMQQLRLSGLALDASALATAQSQLTAQGIQLRQEGEDLLLQPLP